MVDQDAEFLIIELITHWDLSGNYPTDECNMK